MVGLKVAHILLRYLQPLWIVLMTRCSICLPALQWVMNRHKTETHKHNGDDIVEIASPAKATDSFAVRVNKRVKLVEEVGRKKVLNNNAYFKGLNMVSPTSNICERLFSSAGLVWSDLRKAMLPSTLEMLLFLKVNRKLWNGNTVQNALKGDVANE